MFDWLEEIIEAVTEAVHYGFSELGQQISNNIWDIMLKWIYKTIFDAVASFFDKINHMGADIFDIDWIKATVLLFTYFGWALFAAGVVVAIFDIAIEYQNGRANPKTTALNILKGFFACSLMGVLPVELYKFCITLQATFAQDLSTLFASGQSLNIADISRFVLKSEFASPGSMSSLFFTLMLIAFAYCVLKLFFQNIKRGGILLAQIAIDSFYTFYVTRGYSDGFVQWVKQVIALCLTAFLQSLLLYLGLITFVDHMLLGLGIMLAANEVPRIAQQFGLDTTAKFNAMSIVHATSTVVHLSKALVKK